ncbi:MAG: YcgN family cysteine cluster protein [Pseudomonadota bacterium]
MRDEFWKQTPLDAMSDVQWESICDGCGRCCLVKLEDEEHAGDVYYTDVACGYLNRATGRCSDYTNRFINVPNCIKLTRDKVSEFHWLPSTCGYRLLSENKPLADWHPLMSNDAHSVIYAGISVANRVCSERDVSDDELETHVITWVV